MKTQKDMYEDTRGVLANLGWKLDETHDAISHAVVRAHDGDISLVVDLDPSRWPENTLSDVPTYFNFIKTSVQIALKRARVDWPDAPSRTQQSAEQC